MKLTPHVVEKIWGGEFLAKLKNLNSANPIGETWEISTLSEGPSYFEKKPLTDFISPLKYLIKYIDTSDYLSVQVHPDDAYAKMHENSSGKSECWFILGAGPGAGIYLGFKKGVTKNQFSKAIEKKENLSDYLNFYEVKRGDFFFVPAGTVHAIGKGVLLAEVQQSSGITYRVWDWNRLENGKPRKLDVQKALDVLNFSPGNIDYQRNVFLKSKLAFVQHPDFTVDVIQMEKKQNQVYKLDPQKKTSILLLEGEVDLTLSDEQVKLKAYDSIYINLDKWDVMAIQANLPAVLLVVYS